MKELKTHKIQCTPQRVAILSLLKASQVPLTINEIESQIDSSINLSTIYRSLELFEKHNLITKTKLQEPLQPIYQFNDKSHSHHLICTNCQKIIVIEECPLHTYEEQVASESGFLIEYHQLDLYGLCPKCQSHDS